MLDEGSAAEARTQLACNGCGAQVELAVNQRTTSCVYCGSPQVVDRPASADRPNPSFALPFSLPPERALTAAKRWVRGKLFAKRAFRNAPVEEIRGVYVPAYLYSAEARTDYRAEIGENYTVTETYTTTVNGKSQNRTRTKTKTEWRSLEGRHAAYVADQVVTASRGLPNDELEAIEPFDLGMLRRYDKAIISGWAAEEPSLSPDEGAALARDEALETVGRELSDFMPGNKHRELSYRTTLANEDLDLTLLPVWVRPVRFGDAANEVRRLLVNGQSGRVFCEAPTSWLKIGLTVAAVLLLLVGGYALLGVLR